MIWIVNRITVFMVDIVCDSWLIEYLYMLTWRLSAIWAVCFTAIHKNSQYDYDPPTLRYL